MLTMLLGPELLAESTTPVISTTSLTLVGEIKYGWVAGFLK